MTSSWIKFFLNINLVTLQIFYELSRVLNLDVRIVFVSLPQRNLNLRDVALSPSNKLPGLEGNSQTGDIDTFLLFVLGHGQARIEEMLRLRFRTISSREAE